MIREPKNFPCGDCSCDENGHSRSGDLWTIPGVIEKSPICPRRLITQRSHFFLDLYQHYKNGILPLQGGLLDQPNIYMRAMTIIDQWVNKSGKS